MNTGKTSRRNPCGVASNRLVNRVPPDSGVRSTEKSTDNGPPFTNRQCRGRSYSRHSSVTTPLLVHLRAELRTDTDRGRQ